MFVEVFERALLTPDDQKNNNTPNGKGMSNPHLLGAEDIFLIPFNWLGFITFSQTI